MLLGIMNYKVSNTKSKIKPYLDWILFSFSLIFLKSNRHFFQISAVMSKPNNENQVHSRLQADAHASDYKRYQIRVNNIYFARDEAWVFSIM